MSELVIALRADVQPGEKLTIKIVKQGKEDNQGIGYLDDGTMVVIDGGQQEIGNRIEITITGALQNPTGRMIFGKLGKDKPKNKSDNTKATPG